VHQVSKDCGLDGVFFCFKCARADPIQYADNRMW